MDLYRYAAQSPTVYRDSDGLQTRPLTDRNIGFSPRPRPYFATQTAVPGDTQIHDGKTKMGRMISQFGGDVDYTNDKDSDKDGKKGRKGSNDKTNTILIDILAQNFASGLNGTGTSTDDDPYTIVVEERRKRPSSVELGNGPVVTDGMTVDKDMLHLYSNGWEDLLRQRPERPQIRVDGGAKSESVKSINVSMFEKLDIVERVGGLEFRIKDTTENPAFKLNNLKVLTVKDLKWEFGVESTTSKDGATLIGVAADVQSPGVNILGINISVSVEAGLYWVMGEPPPLKTFYVAVGVAEYISEEHYGAQEQE
jgi:hypothetical protein